MAKKTDKAVDESSYLAAMAEGHNFTSPREQPETPKAAPALPVAETVKVKGRASEYEQRFLQPHPIFRERTFVGIRPERYAKLGEIIKRTGVKASIQGYVDAIILHHFETYRDDINRIVRENNRKDAL